MNKATIMGRLGKDPELKKTGDLDICDFSLATTSKYKDKEETEWHNVTFFGKQALVLEKYLQKGMQLLVEGKIVTRNWDGSDGKKRYKTSIIGKEFHFINSPKKEEKPLGQFHDEDDISF